MQKPVYKLVKGDVFVDEAGFAWTVEEITEPDDWRTQGEIGSKGKNWEIRAHNGQAYMSKRAHRSFQYHGCKLVTMKEKV